MEWNLEQDVLQKLKQRRLKRFWMRLVSMMMCAVVFCTTYALILPAITKETETFCGIEEHTHTTACYPHSDELICAFADVECHVHSELCGLRQEQELICTLSEGQGHCHTSQCSVTETVFSCTKAESEGHFHSSGCYAQVLVCELYEDESHTHDSSCYTEQLACEVEEGSGHAHDDSCYTEVVTDICGLAETEPHVHTEACYAVVNNFGCGLEDADHVHTEACYASSSALICGLEEDGTHKHGKDCYNCLPKCRKEEHEHTLECYSNPNADLESASVWEAALPGSRTGILAEDVLAVAKSQLGYAESTENYIVEETGELLGYTRYGAWYGIPYGDWCAMFVSFCLHYAGAEDVPMDASCPNWILQLQDRGMYVASGNYEPAAGDIIFFDRDGDGVSDHVGLVAEFSPAAETSAAMVRTIEGNAPDCVRYNHYNLVDRSILGYGKLPSQVPAELEEQDETVPNPDGVLEDSKEGSVDVGFSSDAIADLISVEPDPMQEFATFGRLNRMMAAAPTAYTTRGLVSTGTIDMAPLIESVTVYRKQNGAWSEIKDGKITEGEDLKFTIDYMVAGYTLSADKNTLVYKIPDNITNIQSSAGAVYNSNKNADGIREEVGIYRVDADAKTITIIFSDEYVENNQLNKVIDASISFYATVEKISTDSSETKDIFFTDEIKIEMEVEKKEDIEGDLNVQKSIASVNGTELTYEIVVSSKTGTFSPVTLTDEMTGGMKMIGSVTVNGELVSSDSYSSTDSGFTMTLPQMAAGDTYTLTYTAELSGTVSGHQLVNNKAVVNSTDEKNSPISDFAEVDHNFKILDKTSGGWQEDGSIQWTIVINEDKADISGAVLSDKITDGGVEAVFDGPVTITDSSGNPLEVMLPYTFPEGSNDTYTVTYTTLDHALVAAGVTNWAGLELKDKNVVFGDEENVTPGTQYPIYKNGQTVSDQDGIIINRWTTTVSFTAGSLPAGSYIQDWMGDQYLTREQMVQLCENVEAALNAKGLTVLKIVAFDYGLGNGSSYTDDLIKTAPQGVRFGEFYVYIKEEVPKGTTFSFSYETTADRAPGAGAFYNYVTINRQYDYNASIPYINDNPIINKYAYDPRNPNQWIEDAVTLDYDKLYEENGEKTLWWRLTLQIPARYAGAYEPIVIEDVLPEGLELAYTKVHPWQSVEAEQILSPDENGHADFVWWEDWNTTNMQRMEMQITTGENGNQTITYTLNGEATSMLQGAKVDMLVVCTFRDDFVWSETSDAMVQVPFTNTVSVQNPNGDVFDMADHKYLISYDQSHEMVSKFGEMNEQNELVYSVVLNEKARNLDPDETTLKVKDVLTYVSPGTWPVKLSLDPRTVKVYDYTGGVKGEQIEIVRFTYTENAVGEGDLSYTHTMDLVLPDSQAMLLEYVYTVDGVFNENYKYDMLNVCTITGVANGGLTDGTKIEVSVYETEAQAGFNGVYIYKADSNNSKLGLPGAVFNLYTWNQHDQKYVRVKHPKTDGSSEEHYAFTTDHEGRLILNKDTMEVVAYNTAYYITEVVAPSGYFLDPTPHYFYIHNNDTEQNPYNFPDGFNGDRLSNGALIYYDNEAATTEISVRKKWQDHNNNPITVTGEQVSSISVELWQKLDGAEGSDKLYGTYTVTPDENGYWELTVKDLPKGVANPDDGTKATLYLYYIKEVNVSNYEASYEYDDGDDATANDANGINTGTITITNRELEGYELPETGSIGTTIFYVVGGLMAVAAVILLVTKKRMSTAE